MARNESGWEFCPPKALQPEDTSCLQFIEQQPPKREYVFKDILPKKVVGGLVGPGGVSKSYLLSTLGIGAATGRKVLGSFEPERPMKVLCLFAEDSKDEVHRRTYATIKHIFPKLTSETKDLLLENYHTKSVMGLIGPLMRLEEGNPVKSDWFEWLWQTVKAHNGLDLLFIDPKSRFFGLIENANEHNVAWIAALEELAQEFGLTIIFSHHVSKASNGALVQTSARGGSALTDSCRWLANLKTMDEATAKRFDVDGYRNFVEFDVSKNNYAPALPQRIFFKRTKNGVLEPVSLLNDRLQFKCDQLCHLLEEALMEGKTLSRRDLTFQPCGKEIRSQMECRRSELESVIDFAVKEGWLIQIEEKTDGKRPRTILKNRDFKAHRD